MDLKALRESRNKLIADARAILDKADAEKRGLTAEEIDSQAKMLADAKRFGETIRNAEEIEAEERGAIPESQRETRREEKHTPEVEARNAAVKRFLRFEETPEDRALVGTTVRANNTLSGAAGGFSIAPDTSMYGRIISAVKQWGGMEQAGATVLNTDTGADLPMATDDDTANSGAIVAEEGSHASGTSPTMGQVVLHAYLYSTLIVKVSWQLIQDGGFDIESWLAGKFGRRLGVAFNGHATTGTGASQPQGMVTAATVGRQSATGNTTSVVADDVIRLIHSVNAAYRGPGCKFMMNDATALAFELLKDGNGQYLWRNGVGLNGLTAQSLAGYPVIINPDMADLATSAKHTAFGDFSNYYIRRVKAMSVLRLNELYAANGQVGFMAFMRMDGGLVDAGQHPIKLLQNSAS